MKCSTLAAIRAPGSSDDVAALVGLLEAPRVRVDPAVVGLKDMCVKGERKAEATLKGKRGDNQKGSVKAQFPFIFCLPIQSSREQQRK